MITKVTQENKGLYKALFEKASADFYGIDEETGAPLTNISSLDQYFSIFEDMTNKLMGEGKVYPVVLPLDEPTFDIDANTRIITVPTDFAKNGISIQGDQVSEIIYFTVDRYFDTTDLFDIYDPIKNPEGVHVIIQWETSAGDRGISPALFQDVDIFKSQGKMLFGWAINNSITEKAGTIKFAVRFYRIQGGEMTFSLSTLSATAKINPSLDFKWKNQEDRWEHQEYDDEFLILRRFKNSVYTDDTQVAAVPEFIEGHEIIDPEIFFDTLEDIDMLRYLVDLNASGWFKLSAAASSDDAGIISYAWKYLPLNASEDAVVAINGADEFVELGDEVILLASRTYYVKHLTNGTPVFVPLTGDYNNVSVGDWLDGSEDKICEKVSSYEAAQAGDYWVIAKNTKGFATKENASKRIRIPGASDLSVDIPDELQHVLLDENGAFELSATGSTEGIGRKGAKDTINYHWTSGNELLKDDSHLNGDAAANDEASTFSDTIDEADRNLFDKTFLVSIHASRNGNNTAPVSRSFRVTDPAKKASVLPVQSEYVKASDDTVEIKAHINLTGILSDKITYQWFKFSRDTDDDPSNDWDNDTAVNPVAIEVSGTDLVDEFDVACIASGAGKYYCKVTNIVNGDANIFLPPVSTIGGTNVVDFITVIDA